MPSLTHVFGVIAVLLTTAAVIVAFLTPSWYDVQSLSQSNGLWLTCNTQDWKNCYWYFDNNFQLEKFLPDWFKATQGLYTCSVVTSIITLLIALGSICCNCRCNEYHATAVFANFTFLLLAASLCVFGAKAHLDFKVGVDPNGLVKFGWSFWLAVGAAGMSLLSTILFVCVGRKRNYHI